MKTYALCISTVSKAAVLAAITSVSSSCISKETDQLLLNTKQMFYKSEHQCMTTAIYMEARGESLKGKIAVANVIMNRVRSKDFRNSICSVVFREGQFSWTKKIGSLSYGSKSSARLSEGSTSVFKPSELPSYRQASEIASKAVLGALPNVLPPGTMWFTTKGVKPKWTSSMKRVSTIGNHVFYKKK